MLPGREDFWNIGFPLFGVFVYTILAVASVSLAYGFFQRYRFWRLGRPMPALGPWGPRLRRFASLAGTDRLMHRRFLKKDLYPGIMHFCLFWGAMTLLIATTVSMIEDNMHQWLHMEFITRQWRVPMSLIWDLGGGGLATIGVSMALYRRYVIKPPRLNTLFEDPVILSVIVALIFTGFLVEGLRIGATELNPQSEFYSTGDAIWSPIGFLFAKAMSGIGMSVGAMEDAHKVMWWSHAAIVAFAFAYAASTFDKMTHMVMGPINALMRSDRPKGALRSMPDLETLDSFGAGDVKDFTWKQLLDLDACTNCGRCQDQCPAWASGKPLSPRKIIQDPVSYTHLTLPTSDLV